MEIKFFSNKKNKKKIVSQFLIGFDFQNMNVDYEELLKQIDELERNEMELEKEINQISKSNKKISQNVIEILNKRMKCKSLISKIRFFFIIFFFYHSAKEWS